MFGMPGIAKEDELKHIRRAGQLIPAEGRGNNMYNSKEKAMREEVREMKWNGYEYVKQRRDGRWGGPREGAGRPRIKDKKKGRSIKFSDEEWDEVRAKADAAGLSMSEYIRERALKK